MFPAELDPRSVAWNVGYPSGIPSPANALYPAGNVMPTPFPPYQDPFGYGAPAGQVDPNAPPPTADQLAPWWHYAIAGGIGVGVGIVGCRMMNGKRRRK
jgi:hypothetical protein